MDEDNIITLEISDSDYFKIPKEVRERTEIKTREPKAYDYSHDEIWQELKKKSTKAYKELKKREFEIRNK